MRMRTHEPRCLAGLLVAGIAFSSLPAQAVPDMCSGSLHERYYNIGVRIGISIVTQAWNGIDEDCDRLEEFDEIVINNMENYKLPPDVSEYVFCRYLGVTEGMVQRVEEAYDECAGECCQEGELISNMAAIAYCQLSFGLGGLQTADDFQRLPAQFCGFVFHVCCDPRFNTVTHTLVDDAWDDPETPDTHEGECRRYTDKGEQNPETGELIWAEVWNQVRNIQCGHSLEPEEVDSENE